MQGRGKKDTRQGVGTIEWKKFSKTQTAVFGAMVKLECEFTFQWSERWSSSAGGMNEAEQKLGKGEGRIEVIRQTYGGLL